MLELIRQIRWKDHLVAIVRLGISSAVLIVALFFYFDQKNTMVDAQFSLESQRLTTDEAELFRGVLKDNMDVYNGLVKDGYIGSPKRLQWLEALRQVGRANGILGIEFTLEGSEFAEQNVDPYWHPEVALKVTDMKMTMQLSHEGDFYRLINGLRENADGLFSVEKCKLRWLENYSEELELTRLRGECRLRWFSVVDVTASWEPSAL